MASQPPVSPPPASPPPATPQPGGSPGGNAMLGRAQRIILTPAPEWDRIDTEPMTEQGIMTGWVAPLAAIGPIAMLIGTQLFGFRIMGVVVKPSLGSAIGAAIVSWITAIAGAYILALIIDALAPTFGATKNRVQALKVAAYSLTASWLVGVIGLIPSLSMLWILGLYSLYLLWIGLPKLMKVPADKVIGYVVASIVCAAVVMMIAQAIANRFAPSPSVQAGGATITITR